MNFLFQLFIYIALTVASSLLASGQVQQQKNAPGVRGSRQVGGDNSRAFVVGKCGLGGQFEYGFDWGNVGGTPNAYHTEVYSLGDLPYTGLSGVYVNGERGTLLTGAAHAELGIPVEEYRRDGKDHLWIKFYDGRQTVADPMLVARSAGSERPWTADMVFRGCPYVVVTALVNRELFTGFPTYLFEVLGIPLYDPRKDSSVGGVGPQRLDDPDTWTYSDEPLVAAYNIFLGVRYQGEWIYGGQTITPQQLPLPSLFVEMNKATARGFKCGYEIICGEVEPQAAIGELLLAAGARVAEIGGLYKFLVAQPNAPVRTFTDEDIIITEDQELDPFPGLEATCNVISSTYPEPAEAWGMKEAPSRYSSALEEADDGRRLPKSLTYKAVPYALQVQELDKMAIEDARRFKIHVNTMPPEWWELEPLDTEAWTSARNGYVNKTFLITAIDDLPNGDQLVARREVDSADYDWSGDLALPWDVSPIGTVRPAPQITTGFAAAPYTVIDATANERRPGIEVSFDDGLLDVRHVRIQVREGWGGKNLIADSNTDYDADASAPSVVISNPAILPSAAYEVRGLYVPFSGRVTRWSNQDVDGTDGPWISVATPDVPEIPPGSITPEMLGTELANQSAILMGDQSGSIPDQLARLKALQETLAGALVDVMATHKQRLDVLDVQRNGASAAIIRNEQAIVEEGLARAISEQEIIANIDNVIAGGFLKFQAEVVGEGAAATITAKVRASSGLAFSQAAWIIRASADGLGGTESEFGVIADTFRLYASSGTIGVPIFSVDEDGTVTVEELRFKKQSSVYELSDGTPVIVINGQTGYFAISVEA